MTGSLKASVRSENSAKRAGSGLSPPLEKIAKELRQVHAAALTAYKAFWEHARRCGDLLIAAKQQIRHGGYERWVTSNTSMSLATAQRYVTIAQHWAKASHVRDLPIATATKLLPKYSGQELEEIAAKERKKLSAARSTGSRQRNARQTPKKQPEANTGRPELKPVWARPSTWEDDLALKSMQDDLTSFSSKAPWVHYSLEVRHQLVEKLETIQRNIASIVGTIRSMDAKIGGEQ